MTADADKLEAVLAKLVRYHGHERVDAWRALAAAGDYARMAAELVTEHYDPKYTRISHDGAPTPATLDLPDLEDPTLAEAAARMVGEAEQE
jgi:tRNA 2-selenouridine synthase